MTTMADLSSWSIDDLRPFVEHLLSNFGPDRVLFGSDWPVSLRAGAYAATVTAARALVAELSESEQRAVLSGTAERIYHSHPMPSWSASSR
jgi:L-fuconolactonase